MDRLSLIFIPLLVIFIIIFALIKKTNAYKSFLLGCSEGLKLFTEVFPSVMAMLLAVRLLDTCGLITDIKILLAKTFSDIALLSELTPMILFRPISGSASIAVLDNICKHGADSFTCKVASTVQGSTDTTLYVLALYFSTVKVTKWKHALKVGLMADVVGITIGILLAFTFLR